MSVKPSAKVIPLARAARRAKRGHPIARSSALSKLDARVAQLEKMVLALDQRMARGAFNRSFQVALALSILIHVVTIGLVSFTLPDKSVVTNDKPLEIVLVNAKSKTRPTKAQALAQHNLDGGGNTDADRRAKSPLPILRNDPQASDVAIAQKRVVQLEQEVRQVLTQNKSTFAAPSGPTQPTPQMQPLPDAPPSLTQAERQRSLNIQRLEAEVSRNWDAYQKRPRRRSIGASTTEVSYAKYVDDWRLKVMRLAETNYPQAAREQKIYGSLVLTVSIRANGSLEGVEVHKSSGQKILDEAAIRIVRMGAPYPPFPHEIAKDIGVLDISRTWFFTSSDRIETD